MGVVAAMGGHVRLFEANDAPQSSGAELGSRATSAVDVRKCSSTAVFPVNSCVLSCIAVAGLTTHLHVSRVGEQ